MNSVDYLLLSPFSSRSYGEKLEVKALGRQTPQIILRNEVRATEKKRAYVRTFSFESYTRIPWLTASTSKKKLFCFPCLLFDTSTIRSVWTTSGYGDLANLSKSVKKHESGTAHKASCISLERFGKERIDTCLSEARAAEVDRYNAEVRRNRDIIHRLVEGVRYLSVHELAFRGNVESSDLTSGAQGNFKGLLATMAKFDGVLKDHLSNPSKVFRGDSATIQNDLIECLALCVEKQVLEELRNASFVAVQVDETTDVSVRTQCSIVFRYVVQSKVVERFLRFVDLSGLANSVAIADVILNIIDELGIGDKLVGQSYDGAAVMSGRVTGVQKIVSDKYPLACFVHCWAHKLNLVVQKSVESLPKAKVFFATLEGFHAFFRDLLSEWQL